MKCFDPIIADNKTTVEPNAPDLSSCPSLNLTFPAEPINKMLQELLTRLLGTGPGPSCLNPECKELFLRICRFASQVLVAALDVSAGTCSLALILSKVRTKEQYALRKPTKGKMIYMFVSR